MIIARTVAFVLAAAVLQVGCASAVRHDTLTARFVRPAPTGAGDGPAPYDTAAPADSLETAIGKVRELAARARPVPRQSQGSTLETLDGTLAAALLAVKTLPSAESHTRVAEEYARLGVLDAAHRHYRAALASNRRAAAAYDGLARLWRDAGLPALALGDARRAVYYAPRSPEALNTLGTVFQALGMSGPAQRAYEHALSIEPGAAYALNNLGYLALVEGNAARALGFCQRAVAADPALTAGRHNLALAYAAAGRMDLVRQTLRDGGSVARADYNEGIINLSLGRPAAALAAFEAACQTRVAPRDSCDRARVLKDAADRVDGGGE